mgnify:CR=1 FL=1
MMNSGTVNLGDSKISGNEAGMGGGGYGADTWEFDGQRWRPVQTSGAPSGRGGAPMACARSITAMVLPRMAAIPSTAG